MKKIIKFIIGIAFIAGLSLVYAATHSTQSFIQGAFSSTTGSVNPQVVLAFPSGAGGTTNYVTNGITNLTYFKLLTGVYPSPLIGTPPASYNVTNAFNIISNQPYIDPIVWAAQYGTSNNQGTIGGSPLIGSNSVYLQYISGVSLPSGAVVGYPLVPASLSADALGNISQNYKLAVRLSGDSSKFTNTVTLVWEPYNSLTGFYDSSCAFTVTALPNGTNATIITTNIPANLNTGFEQLALFSVATAADLGSPAPTNVYIQTCVLSGWVP
jgi:hypothetical protein